MASRSILDSSILRKQIVAVTGLALVGFILAHLSGNLLIFGGPEMLNGYAKKLRDLGALLWVLRIGLLAAFLTHVFLTIQLTLENRAARIHRYAVGGSKVDVELVFAKRTMILSGLVIFVYIGLHLIDFTFRDHHGPNSIVAVAEGDPVDLGLYGLVWNSFLQPWRAILYLFVMVVLGFHLAHAIQSVATTLGYHDWALTPKLRRASLYIGMAVALAYSLIPIYINILQKPPL